MEKNRQSVDFKEIWNVQTDMKVTDEKWDQLFHNWDFPMNCENRKKPTGCIICDALEKGPVIRVSTGELYDKTGKI